LNLDNEAIIGYLNQLDNESRAIKDEAIRLSWYMRGGVTYEDAMVLSQVERKIISNLIKENMETTKKSGLPFF
jgi:hypothetical protein